MAFKDIAGKILGFADKGVETIDKVASGDLGAIAESAGWIRFMWWAKFIMWFAIIFIIMVIIWHFWFKYNKKVLIKKLKGSAVIDTYMDRGRITTDMRKKTKLSLLKTRKTCPVPSYKYTTKMGKKDFYELYLDDKGNLYPIDDTNVIRNVEGIKSDKSIDYHILAAWRLEEMKLAEEKFKKKTFLSQHMPEILIFMSMVLCTAMVWITMKGIENAGVQHAQAIAELARALSQLR